MRRLTGLAVTIGVRVFLVLAIVAWGVSRTHYGGIMHRKGYLAFNSVCVSGLIHVDHVWSAESWLVEHHPATELSFQEAFEYDGLKMRIWQIPGLLMLYYITPGQRAIQVCAEHKMMLSVGLFANVAHWLYHRRRQRAVACEG